MIMRVRFCLSYDLLNEILSPSNISMKIYIVVTDIVMMLLVPADSVMQRVVITLFMA